MPKITFISFEGERHTVEVASGTTLMRAATEINANMASKDLER